MTFFYDILTKHLIITIEVFTNAFLHHKVMSDARIISTLLSTSSEGFKDWLQSLSVTVVCLCKRLHQSDNIKRHRNIEFFTVHHTCTLSSWLVRSNTPHAVMRHSLVYPPHHPPIREDSTDCLSNPTQCSRQPSRNALHTTRGQHHHILLSDHKTSPMKSLPYITVQNSDNGLCVHEGL